MSVVIVRSIDPRLPGIATCTEHLMAPCPCRRCDGHGYSSGNDGSDPDWCARCGGDGCDPEVRDDCDPREQIALDVWHAGRRTP